MKMGKTLAIVFGLTIGTTVPVVAAETEVDVSNCTTPKIWQDAFNKGDAMAIAGLYTNDAVEVTPMGVRVGPAAVKERIEDSIKRGITHAVIPVTKCVVDDNLRWSIGDWSYEFPQGHMSGFWTLIEAKQGNTWKIKNLTYNMTPPPPNKQQ